NSSSSNLATVLATNAANATAKNWKVQYYKNNSDITTTGSYDCSTAVAEAATEPSLTLYPNPVADVLYLSANARTVRIYDMYGTEVAHAYDTDKVEVSHLPAGIYTVKADGTVAKMVKR
ncbi:MAG: T9SS type A sorting domain-containing protein, partial [Bacteroidota bacterium]